MSNSIIIMGIRVVFKFAFTNININLLENPLRGQASLKSDKFYLFIY